MSSFGIFTAYLLDLILGDSEKFFHPVKAIGSLIKILDNRLYKKEPKWRQRLKGTILALFTIGISGGVVYLILNISERFNSLLGGIIWIYLAYSTIAIKDLRKKATDIYITLKSDIALARKNLSKIVGRDTQNLDKKEVITATIESIAENTNDGIVAPLFYLILGGPSLAMAYKAINTLDSMIGYKNEKYIHFGWFSAKLDDIANFIPARICAFLTAVSSLILGKGFRNSFKIMVRDGSKHLSPNSGLSEAAFAGSLGLKLGGPAYYQGKLCSKPYLGEGKRTVSPDCIKEALVLSFTVSFLTVIWGGFFRWLI